MFKVFEAKEFCATAPPTAFPSRLTISPTASPTLSPTRTGDTLNPTGFPTKSPTMTPSVLPTSAPSQNPTVLPTSLPSASPTSIFIDSAFFPLMPIDETYVGIVQHEGEFSGSKDASLNSASVAPWTLAYRARVLVKCAGCVETKSERLSFMGQFSWQLAKELGVPMSRVPVIAVQKSSTSKDSIAVFFHILPGLPTFLEPPCFGLSE